MKYPSRKSLDEAFPTLVRYTGLLLVIGNSVYTAFRGLELPGLYVAAAGMILYKEIRGIRNGNGNGSGKNDNSDTKKAS